MRLSIKQRAAKELLRRKNACNDIVAYAEYIDIPGAPVSPEEENDDSLLPPVETTVAAHHELLLRVFQDVVEGKIKNAMFFLPPGAAKSTYGSVVGPTWAMGKIPNYKIILTSYGSNLAKKHGRRARQIVKSDKFKRVFNQNIKQGVNAADFWSLENDSEYMSAGILSGITGNRANLLVIDDPVKGREEADSATMQDKTWDAYQDDLKTRLIPGGGTIIIQTRWSDNDVSGKILPDDYKGETGLIACKDGQDWYVVCLPAECERDDDPLGRKIGDYLWPEWFNEEHFRSFKAQPRTWNALYQQRPSPEEGTFFKRPWFVRYKEGSQPERLNHYLTSDHAPGGESHNDFNCFRMWGIDSDDNIWLRKGFSAQETIDKSIKRAISLIKTFRPFCWFPEDDNNWKSVSGFVRKEILKAKSFVAIEPVSPHGHDKQTKAQAFQGMAAMGKVFIPEGEEGDAIIAQYMKFPGGANDDEICAASIIGRVLDEAHPAVIRPEQKTPMTTAENDFAIVTGQKTRTTSNMDAM